MGQIYLMEQNKTPASIPSKKKKYEYVVITQRIQSLDLEDFEHLTNTIDLEQTEDDEMEIFLRVSQMKNLKEMEYLVLKLMGYEFFEMPEILGVKNLNSLYQIGNHMKNNFEKTDKGNKRF